MARTQGRSGKRAKSDGEQGLIRGDEDVMSGGGAAESYGQRAAAKTAEQILQGAGAAGGLPGGSQGRCCGP